MQLHILRLLRALCPCDGASPHSSCSSVPALPACLPSPCCCVPTTAHYVPATSLCPQNDVIPHAARLEVRLAQAAASYATAAMQRDAMQQAAETAKSELFQMKAQLAAAETSREGAASQARSASSEMESIKAAVAAGEQRVRELEQGLAQKEEQVEELTAALDDARQRGASAASLAAEVARLSAAVAAESASRDALSRAAAASETAVAALREQLAALEVAAAANASAVASRENELAALRARFDGVSSERDVAVGRQAAAETEAARVRGELGTLKEELRMVRASMQDAAEAAAAEVSQLRAALADRELALERAQIAASETHAEKEALQAAALDAASEAGRLREALGALETQAQIQLESTKREAQEQVAGVERQLVEAEQQLAAVVSEKGQMEEVVGRLQSELGAKSGAGEVQEVGVLHALVSELQASLVAASAHINNLEQQVKHLELELRVANAQAQELGQMAEAAVGAAKQGAVHVRNVKVLQSQLAAVQNQLGRVRAEEKALRESEVLKVAKTYEARIAAQARLFIEAKEADVKAAVAAVTKAALEQVKAKEAEVASLTDEVDRLTDSVQDMKLSLARGLGLALPPSPPRTSITPSAAAAAPSASSAAATPAEPAAQSKPKQGGWLSSLFGGGGKKEAAPAAPARRQPVPAPGSRPAPATAAAAATAKDAAARRAAKKWVGTGSTVPLTGLQHSTGAPAAPVPSKSHADGGRSRASGSRVWVVGREVQQSKAAAARLSALGAQDAQRVTVRVGSPSDVRRQWGTSNGVHREAPATPSAAAIFEWLVGADLKLFVDIICLACAYCVVSVLVLVSVGGMAYAGLVLLLVCAGLTAVIAAATTALCAFAPTSSHDFPLVHLISRVAAAPRSSAFRI